MPAIRVLIVDDSVFIREALSPALTSDSEIEIAGTASSGERALALLRELRPSLVTLDLALPGMSGLATLEQIRKVSPDLPVILLSTFSETAMRVRLDARSWVVTDYIRKPTEVGGDSVEARRRFRNELISKIKSLSSPAGSAHVDQAGKSLTKKLVRTGIDIVAVGASTGGPAALADLIAKLPADFPAPVLIVQHMPPKFTGYLAERLDGLTLLQVREGRPGAILAPGQVWIAPGDYHMTVARQANDVVLMINRQTKEQGCRPSVDVLFRSVAETCGANVLGVVLTGMGADGTSGAQAIWDAGGEVIVQDEATSAIWGMPGRVVAAGLARSVCPLSSVPFAIMSRVYAERQPGKPARAFAAR